MTFKKENVTSTNKVGIYILSSAWDSTEYTLLIIVIIYENDIHYLLYMDI